jgi:dephospho-CoA kinase
MDEVFRRDPEAIAVVESALIFEVERDARARGEQESVLSDWRRRFDRVIVVVAPDALKIARYASRLNPKHEERAALEADARRRLVHQMSDAEKAARADYLIENNGDLVQLRAEVTALWQRLTEARNNSQA